MNHSMALVDHEEKKSKCIAENYLDIICENSPVVSKTISEYGHLQLGKYLKCIEADFRTNFQKIDDLADIVYSYANRFFGPYIASKASSDFRSNPVATPVTIF